MVVLFERRLYSNSICAYCTRWEKVGEFRTKEAIEHYKKLQSKYRRKEAWLYKEMN